MAGLDLMEIIVDGNGTRFEKIIKNHNQIRTFDYDEDKLKIFIGEGKPDDDVKIWITKTESNNFHSLIEEMKSYFKHMEHLQVVGVDNFNSIALTPKMCIVVTRDNLIKTFQNPDDLNVFILEMIEINLLQ